MPHPLKNILNKLRWSKDENPEDYLITYRHRGAPGDIKKMRASMIGTLAKSYFTIEETAGEETTIPFHRILEVRNTKDNSVLWVKRQGPGK